MKRAVFRNTWLPYALLAPQFVIILLFFYWPAADSLRLSLYRASPFGDRLIFIGLGNFERLFRDDAYLRSGVTSIVFAFAVTFLGLGLALFLAAMANAKIRGLPIYRSLLLWPYGIAPAVAGMVWLFIFNPSYGVLPYLLSFVTTYRFNWLLEGWVALRADRRDRGVEAVRLQSRVLPGRAPGDPGLGAGGGERRRGGADPQVLRDHLPPALARDVLPLHART